MGGVAGYHSCADHGLHSSLGVHRGEGLHEHRMAPRLAADPIAADCQAGAKDPDFRLALLDDSRSLGELVGIVLGHCPLIHHPDPVRPRLDKYCAGFLSSIGGHNADRGTPKGDTGGIHVLRHLLEIHGVTLRVDAGQLAPNLSDDDDTHVRGMVILRCRIQAYVGFRGGWRDHGRFHTRDLSSGGDRRSALARRKAAQSKMHSTKMRLLFDKMKQAFECDTIDVETFATMLANREVQMWLKALDYDASDAGMLFQLIDKNGDGTLSLDELIEGMASLKGTARNMDVKLLLHPGLLDRKRVKTR